MKQGRPLHRIMFVCHGNICRSTMAEFVMKDLVEKRGLADSFVIASSAMALEGRFLTTGPPGEVPGRDNFYH